jgi:uncharacterized membrane protein
MEPLTKTVAFKVTEKNFKRGKDLPRSFNIPDKLREAYVKILEEGGV